MTHCTYIFTLILICFHLFKLVWVGLWNTIKDSCPNVGFSFSVAGKRRRHSERKNELSSLSNLIKIKLKHVNGKRKFPSQEINNTTIYLQYLLTYSYVLFSDFLARWLAYTLTSNLNRCPKITIKLIRY